MSPARRRTSSPQIGPDEPSSLILDSFSLPLNKKITRKLGNVLKLLIHYAREKNIVVLNASFFESYQSLDKMAQQFFLFSNNLPGISSAYFYSPDKLNHIKLSYPLWILDATNAYVIIDT